MSAVLKNINSRCHSLSELTRDDAVSELILCHEMFRRCLSLLEGEYADPVELFTSSELGDSDDMELYYKCVEIYERERS